MQIKGYDNQVYDLPDDATLEEINEIAGKKNISEFDRMAPDISRIMEESGGNRTPFNTLMDIATGLGKGGQRLGQFATDVSGTFDPLQRALQASGKETPEAIKRLSQPRQEIDIAETLGTKNGNPLAQAFGQYLAPGMVGGASLPAQVLANSLYGYTQGKPGEQNLGGFLPSGRAGSAIEAGALSAIPFGLAKIPQALNYLRPGKAAEEFMINLGKSGVKPVEGWGINPERPELPTAGENIAELGQRMKFGRESAEQEALIPKEKLMTTEAKQRVIPSQKRIDVVANDVAKIFEKKAVNELDKPRAKELTKALKEYYKTGDFDALLNKGEEIFEHPGLSKSETKSLNKAVEMEPLKEGNYLSNPNVDKNYKGLGLDEAHAKFKKNPTLENADKLHSNIAEEIRRLESIGERSGGLVGSNRVKYNRLIANKKALLNDMENYFGTLSPEKQALYKEFRTKWATHVPKYSEEGNTIKSLSEGNAKGLTREEVTSAFKSPNEAVEQILSDIGPGGERNILYNSLIGNEPTDAKKLAESILNLKRSGGYERYITPQDEAFANELIKRLKYQKAAKWGAAGLAGLLGGGAALRKLM